MSRAQRISLGLWLKGSYKQVKLPVIFCYGSRPPYDGPNTMP
jgi:hypothetical protein